MGVSQVKQICPVRIGAAPDLYGKSFALPDMKRVDDYFLLSFTENCEPSMVNCVAILAGD